MSKRLRISLVIPAYNEEQHLAACLQAVFAQRLPFYEVFVVDNNSTDSTVAVAARFPSVKVVREQCQGIVFARNRGFNTATGDVIARIDTDTVLPPNWSAHIMAFYGNQAHANTAWTGAGSFIDVPFRRLVSSTYNMLAFRTNQLLIGHPTLWGSNMALPAQMWQAVAGETCQRRGIHEDLDLAIHVHEAGGAVFYDKRMPVPAHLRRVHASRPELWDYLQWWPQTLKQHGYRVWRLCWLIGVLPLYLATPLLTTVGALSRAQSRLAQRVNPATFID
jgi:glycosyltransferase involved in cell wall biosynthesis